MQDQSDACWLTGLSRTYGMDLAIRTNEFFTLLGPSGCGKTSLLRLIAWFNQSSQGEVSIFGRDVTGLPPEDRPVNTVFQHCALFPRPTIALNVGFALCRLGRPRAEIADTVALMVPRYGSLNCPGFAGDL